MNRHVTKLGLVAAIGAMGAMMAGTALATPLEMNLSSGSSTATGISVYPTANAAGYYNADFNGWDVEYIMTGNSNSPSLTPFGIDLGGVVAACQNASGCDPLTVSVSDTGFTTPTNGLETTLSDTQTGMGSVMQQAYYDTSNSYFGTGGSIGSVTLNGSGTMSAMGGGPLSGMYSLTLVDTFSTSCTSTGCASFSIDGNITSVPEPGTLALFGAGLLGCGLFLVRRRRARQS